MANVLAVLSKLQVEVYSSERLKKIEAVLVPKQTGLVGWLVEFQPPKKSNTEDGF